MSVVFIGAGGFLGSRVLRRLLAEGTRERVTVLGRGSPGKLRERVTAAVAWLDGPPLDPGAPDRVRYLGADLTLPGLGLDPGSRARLAAGTEVVWHCAGPTRLIGDDPAPLYAGNVRGTRAVLDLAEEAADAHFVHVSTAFVAGRRRTGHIKEDDLSDAHGFATYYEESKYTAEKLVRAWAERHGRAVTVARPSLLLADRPAPAGIPAQPLDVVSRLIDEYFFPAREPGNSSRLRGGTASFRLPGDPRGTLNLLQADYAADALTRVVAAHRARTFTGVRTVHLTHPCETGFTVAKEAFETLYPGLTLTLTPKVPNPSRPEAVLAEHAASLLDFSDHRRTYDRSHLLADLGGLPDPPPVDSDCLRRALDRSGGRGTSMSAPAGGAEP
ncbi:SDR family oxidoreductase [Streptomyces morookaense]|uniref:SDR family oxidoreductase n=1 Tax=Streptomyces morookaense TaxID=1970 RepID=UPI00340B66E1